MVTDESWPDDMTFADKLAAIIAAHRIFKQSDGDHHDRNLWTLFDEILEEHPNG